MNLFIKEIQSPLEIIKARKYIKSLQYVRKTYLYKYVKNIVKTVIKLHYILFYIFGKVKVSKIKEGILCSIPLQNKEKKNRYIKIEKHVYLKFIKKINNVKKIYNIHNVIISEKIKKIDIINSQFSGVKKIEGKEILKYMLEDVIKYICNQKNTVIQNQTIYIVVSQYSKDNLQIIKDLAFKVKNINIVTNNIKKFTIFENKFYKENGIMISVSNNKRKALARANVIINVDLQEEKLKEYNINRTATFINLLPGKIEISKSFSGIIINGLSLKNYNMCENGYNWYKLFNKTELIEETYLKNMEINKVKDVIKSENLKIDYLIGNKGVLNNFSTISK